MHFLRLLGANFAIGRRDPRLLEATFANKKRRGPPSRIVSKGVTPSELTKHIFKIFWNPLGGYHNLATTGMMIDCEGGKRHIKIRFKGLLGDAKGLSEQVSHRGANAKKSCPGCLNLVGRTKRHLVEPGLVHLHDASNFHMCIRHSAASYAIMAAKT